MNLKQATNVLIQRKDVAAMLSLADDYIATANKQGSRFVLPSEHDFLKPVVKAFAGDLDGFVDYIKGLRDQLGGVTRDQVHTLYRRIYTRSVQRPRRRRTKLAMNILVPQIQERIARDLAFHEVLAITAKVETCWGLLRRNYLAEVRDGTHAEWEEHTANSQAFMAELEQSLEKGNVPLPPGFLEAVVKEYAQ